MNEKPCRRESCTFSMKVFGEADPSEEKCLYPDAKWIKTDIDQTVKCDPCPKLSIHCGSLANIQIIPSKERAIQFRLYGNYYRPEDASDLYISLRVSRGEKFSRSLILQGPGYLCEAYQADGLTLEVAVPKDWRFETFSANGKAISSLIPVSATTHVRMSALENIDAKLCSPRVIASAHSGIYLRSEAVDKLTVADITCDSYIELTLSGYDCCDVTYPVPGVRYHRNYRLSLIPTTFSGKVLSHTGEAVIF